MKKYIVSIIGGLAVGVALVVACMTIADIAYTNSKVKAESPAELTRTADRVATETPIAAVKIIEIKNEETTAPIIEEDVPEVKYFECGLSEDIQDVIFAECEKYGISPSIVIAMIERESQFDRYEIGDDGRSFGLMQVQPKYHLERMIELGCTDLFDPIQNVTVGIDYLAEMQNRYGDIAKALVAYNGGSYKGIITNYASAVMARANELENEF